MTKRKTNTKTKSEVSVISITALIVSFIALGFLAVMAGLVFSFADKGEKDINLSVKPVTCELPQKESPGNTSSSAIINMDNLYEELNFVVEEMEVAGVTPEGIVFDPKKLNSEIEMVVQKMTENKILDLKSGEINPDRLREEVELVVEVIEVAGIIDGRDEGIFKDEIREEIELAVEHIIRGEDEK